MRIRGYFSKPKGVRKKNILRNTALEYEKKKNNINSQADETITNFIDNCIQLNIFRGIISPILRSTRLCLKLVVKCTDDAAFSIVGALHHKQQTQSSLVKFY